MESDSTRLARYWSRGVSKGSIVVAVLIVLFLLAGIVTVGAQSAEGRISDFSYSGEGYVYADADERSVWLSEQHQFTVALTSPSGIEDAAVCLVIGIETAEDDRTLTCKPTSVPADGTQEVRVPIDSWPDDLAGKRSVRAVLKAPNGSGEVVDTETLSMTVIRKDGDLDGEGLKNEREVSMETDLRNPDTDGDGLDDKLEVDTHETNPTSADTDGDGLSDDVELEEHQTDPTATDTDGDGLPDDRELELGTNPNREDTDGDGVTDGAEVNTYETDPTKPDTDGDGLDDGAEVDEHDTNPTSQDTDDDGLTDNLEVNTYGTDPHEIDTDGDGLEDGAEVEEYGTDPTESDSDGDGLDDGKEVNTYGTNPTAADTDGDGLEDGPEVNKYGTDPAAADTDGDGVSDREEVNRGVIGRLTLPMLGGLAAIALAGTGLLYVIVRRSRFRSVRLPFTTGDHQGAGSGDGQPDEDIPPEFLQNHERVLALLEAHDGHVRQSEIVEETGWSKSKVSRVLSEMEGDGRIAKIDIGRGNVIARPEDVPEEVRSRIED
jgi:hypothetical protein